MKHRMVQAISDKKRDVVFILWGGFAQKKGKVINESRHCVLKAAHPSPLSVTKFRGCKSFSKTNDFLRSKGIGEIDWHLK